MTVEVEGDYTTIYDEDVPLWQMVLAIVLLVVGVYCCWSLGQPEPSITERRFAITVAGLGSHGRTETFWCDSYRLSTERLELIDCHHADRDVIYNPANVRVREQTGGQE